MKKNSRARDARKRERELVAQFLGEEEYGEFYFLDFMYEAIVEAVQESTITVSPNLLKDAALINVDWPQAYPIKFERFLLDKDEDVKRFGPQLMQDDSWICLCGNHPISDGFYPCDSTGKQVEPTPEEWPVSLYVCDRCGRIINRDTVFVVGYRKDNTLTTTERKEIREVAKSRK